MVGGGGWAIPTYRVLLHSLITKNILLVHEKTRDISWLNTSLKSTETRDVLSTILYLQSEINFF